MSRNHRQSRLLARLVAGALAAAAFGVDAARADDRDFVRKAVDNPYVFFLLDTSGSMNWTPNCTAAQAAAGVCNQVCATGQGDCYTPLQADSRNSKFYQAKQALYEVISTIDNVQFGFFTYNQDRLGVFNKHWLYRAKTTFNWTECGTTPCTPLGNFPPIGTLDVFGQPWACDQGGGDNEIGCFVPTGNPAPNSGTINPADTNDAWELNRVHYWPKLDEDNDTDSTFFVRTPGANGKTFSVTYEHSNEAFGSPEVTIELEIRRCNNSDCTNNTLLHGGDKAITFELVDEFLSWDNGANRNAVREGYFPQGVTDHDATGVCDGWDANTDSSSDTYPAGVYNIRIPTATADPRGQAFTNGDVIPADYASNKKSLILSRLNPGGGTDGFDQAPYFNDFRSGSEGFLRLRNASQIPFIAEGSTPIGASITDFYDWLRNPTSGTGAGWRVRTKQLDPSWGCRRKYLIVLTDGDDTCSSVDSVCNAVTNLRTQEAFRTFIVAFGVPGGGDALKCMAENGGQPDCKKCKVALPSGAEVISNTCLRPGEPGYATCDSTPGCQKCTVDGCLKLGELDYAQCDDTRGDPLYPQNKDELVRQLTNIFQTINEESRAFASAAVPSVEANVKDKIFLSDFTPLEGASIWAGQLDAYLKPLPFRSDGSGIPEDRGAKDCGPSGTSNCHIWDAGTVLLSQAPDAAQAALGNYRLGLALNQRRVFYPAGLSRELRLFQPPIDDVDWADLFSWNALGFNGNAVNAANKTRATNIIASTLRQKTAVVTDRTGTHQITYVMGDVFHSDPVVIESPNSLTDFATKRFSENRPCNLTPSSDQGYQCFAFKHQYRRKVLVVGTNDSQMHAFDAGIFNRTTNVFDNGTGVEAFSFIPRMALSIVREQAEDNLHAFGVDGPMVTGDAYFHSDTEWHTLVIGGMREGGRKLGGGRVLAPESGATTGGSCTGTSEIARMGYFALDVTQPDPLQLQADPAVQGGSRFVPTDEDPVPGCVSISGSTPANCPRPYPALLWEFTDTVSVDGQPLDEDLNNVADLANPWSRPIITRIKLLVDDGQGGQEEQMKFVAVLGGGLDPNNKNCAMPGLAGPGPMPNCAAGANGNWIYMLDVEDGSILYKRRVDGSVPSVAVVDGNADTFADFIYFGTTAGSLYKVDVRTAQERLPVTVRDRCGAPVAVHRVTAAAWEPLRIFVTGQPGARPPIYQPIQALFITRLNTHALVFGVGDRENLWTCGPGAPAHCGCGPSTPGECTTPAPSEPSSPGNTPGRLYVVVDDGFTTTTPGLPRTENNYKQILPDSVTVQGLNKNLLLQPDAGQQRGWYMLLSPDERVITEGFGLAGILLFSTFQPDVIPEGSELDRVCSRTGRTRNFVVFAFNGDPVSNLTGSSSDDRYLSIDDFVTSPFVEQTQTQNLSGNPSGGAPPTPPPGSSCTSDPRLSGIVSKLKAVPSLAPPNALYGNFFLRIGQRESKEGIHYAACVPIGIVQANWKEN